MHEQANLEPLVGKIVKDPQLHARWINTFSFLEYIGFRKIVKSQQAETLNATTLGHAVEEGRHALRLKKLAIQTGGPAFESYTADVLLCGEEAEDYFQSLDHQCEALFADRNEAARSRLTYLYVTWLVERRALEVYGLYKKILGDGPVAQKLDGLLAEEVGHLRQVESEIAQNDPQHETHTRLAEALETKLYEAFIGALSASISARADASL